MFGVILAAYQLWIAAQLARQPPKHSAAKSAEGTKSDLGVGVASSIEISSNTVRVQTSIVGVLLLIISGVFLILFLREVYHVNVIDLASGGSGEQVKVQTPVAR